MNPLINNLKCLKLTDEDINKFKLVVESLEKDNRSIDFLEPVDYIKFGLHDYPDIIKQPMDLSTLKKKLISHNYSTIGDAIDDLQLIWNNCKTYNVQGSDIWKLANTLEKVSYKLIEKNFKLNTKEMKNKLSTSVGSINNNNNSSMKYNVKKEDNDNNDINSDNNNDNDDNNNNNNNNNNPDNKLYLTLTEKIQLTERVRKLSNEGLAAFVRLIQKQCTSAFDDLDQEKVQVKVDYIDKHTYELVQQLLDEYLNN